MTARLWNLALYGVIFLTLSGAAERVLSTGETVEEIQLRQATLWGLMLVVLALVAPGLALQVASRGPGAGAAVRGLFWSSLGILWRTAPYLLAIPVASLRSPAAPRLVDVSALFFGFGLAVAACGKLMADRADPGGVRSPSRRLLPWVALYATVVVLVFRAAHPEETFWPLIFTRGSILTPPKAGGSLHTAAPTMPPPRHPLPTATPTRVKQLVPPLVMLAVVLAMLSLAGHRPAPPPPVRVPGPLETIPGASPGVRQPVGWSDWLVFWATVLVVLLNATGVEPSPGPGHSAWILFEATSLLLAAVLAARTLPAGSVGWFGLVAAVWGACLQLFRSGTGTEGTVLAPLVFTTILGVSLIDRGIVATLEARFSPGLHTSLQRLGTAFTMAFFLILDATLFRFLYQSEPQVMLYCWLVLKSLALVGMGIAAWFFAVRVTEDKEQA